jgi:hypothetical protein
MGIRFLFGGELVGSRLNWSLGVDGSIRTFTRCDYRIVCGDMLVEHIDRHSLINYSLVTTSGESFLDYSTIVFFSSLPCTNGGFR